MVNELQDRVIAHLQDCHAMEESVLGMLDSMIATTNDSRMKTILQRHRGETMEHAARVDARLHELGGCISLSKTAIAAAGRLVKTAVDMVRSEKNCKNLRDAFITEHGEIAGYALLESYARRANDFETAAIAKQIKAEEIAMAHRLNELWDRAVDNDLILSGVPAETLTR